MFTKPKRGKGFNESPVCYATKQLWAIVCFYEIYEDITFKYFIEHIEDFIKKYKFDWPKGKPYPNYKTACLWPSKYDYKECVQCYENYKLNYNTEKADSIHDKKYLTDTVSDFKHYDKYDKLIDEELNNSEPDFKKIEQLENLKERVWNRNIKRSGRDVKKIEGNINSNINADVGIATNETEEERLNRYANYFERINNKATSISSNNNSR